MYIVPGVCIPENLTAWFYPKKSRFTKSILDLKLKLKNSKKESKMIENRDSSGMPILQANLSIIQVITNHGWNQLFLDS